MAKAATSWRGRAITVCVVTSTAMSGVLGPVLRHDLTGAHGWLDGGGRQKDQAGRTGA